MKKVKKKVKEVGEEEKEKEESLSKEPEGPTEKDVFEIKIKQLKRQLENCDVGLRRRTEALEEVRRALESQMEIEESCVSYLKRVLKFESDRRLNVQEKLQSLRDQTELVQKRALGKLADSERNQDAINSQFLQHKLELEGKLSLLEDLRLKRNSQLAHLKKVEEALEEKISALREKSREEDVRQVDNLLKSREEFLEKCRQIRHEWREAFHLRMPVHAKRQLEENVRLRERCHTASEKLLQVQDQNRNLKNLQKSLELEEEVQTSAEEDASKRKVSQEKRLRKLLLVREGLQTVDEQQSFSKQDVDDPANSIVERYGEKNDVFRGASMPENIIKRNNKKTDVIGIEKQVSIQQGISTLEDDDARGKIADSEAKKCRLLDRCKELESILDDQATYKLILEEELEQNTNENGELMSAILRAGKIFETRCSKVSEDQSAAIDFNCLQQIRFLLDLVPNDV